MNNLSIETVSAGELTEQLESIDELPTLPQMTHHLRHSVSRHGCGLREIKRAILLDPPTTAVVLREASQRVSGKPIRSLDDALSLLEPETVAQLCARQPHLITFDSWNDLGLNSSLLWRHALETGILAKGLHLRKRMHMIPGPDPYLVALLHHIGWHVLDAIRPDLLRQAIAMFNEDGIWSLQRERDLFGMDHAEIGARLLESWGVDESIVRVVRHHHEPHRAGRFSGLAGLVQVASTLAATPFPLDEPMHEFPKRLPNRIKARSGPQMLPELRKRYDRYILQAESGSRMMLGWL